MANLHALFVMRDACKFYLMRHDERGGLVWPVGPGEVDRIVRDADQFSASRLGGRAHGRDIVRAHQFRVIADALAGHVLRFEPAERAGLRHSLNFPEIRVGLVSDL